VRQLSPSARGTLTSTSATGSTNVSPTVTMSYVLTASNGAGSATATATVTVTSVNKPTISSFAANPASIASGNSSTLSWTTDGATGISITPGTFTSTSASGSTTVNPTTTTSYVLTASNSAGSSTATATVTVTTGTIQPLSITTTSCPSAVQYQAYSGCTIAATGGTLPYTFSWSSSSNYASLPPGMQLDASTGAISSSLIGGQGTYNTEFIVTDSAKNTATQLLNFAIQGMNSFAVSIFPSDSIFHHRVDAATTGLPVDASPAGNSPVELQTVPLCWIISAVPTPP
jgi:hypothetical protein